MKASFVLLLFVVGLKICISQNLIENGSFENNIGGCPTNLNSICNQNLTDQLLKTPPWYMPTCGSADFFHACGAAEVSIPDNYQGYQNARTGNAYAGIIVYDKPFENMNKVYREYIQAPLKKSMQKGKSYCVSLWVTRAEDMVWAIADIGVLFTTSPYINKQNYLSNIPLSPQIVNNNGVIRDTVNWVQISSSFIADSSYNYITIGNFKGLNQSTVQQIPMAGAFVAYYYIDDVSVIEAAIPNAGSYTTICKGDSIQLGEAGDTITTYSWFPPSTLTTATIARPMAFPTITTTYYLTINTCRGNLMDSVTVNVIANCDSSRTNGFYIPNIFSPNSDGLNDVFYVYDDRMKLESYRIYDRWGNLIFKTKDTNIGWDGTFNDQLAVEDVYIWVVDYLNYQNEKKRLTGRVVLIR